MKEKAFLTILFIALLFITVERLYSDYQFYFSTDILYDESLESKDIPITETMDIKNKEPEIINILLKEEVFLIGEKIPWDINRTILMESEERILNEETINSLTYEIVIQNKIFDMTYLFTNNEEESELSSILFEYIGEREDYGEIFISLVNTINEILDIDTEETIIEDYFIVIDDNYNISLGFLENIKNEDLVIGEHWILEKSEIMVTLFYDEIVNINILIIEK